MKTPEELTAEWKAGKLEDGAYYIQFNDGCVEVARLETWYEEPGKRPEKDFSPYFDSEITSVLAPVPTYDEYKAMQDQIADANKKVEWEISKNKALENQLTEAKKGIKRNLKAFELMCDSNDELRALLKECKDIIEWYKADCGYKDLPTESVLTKIEEVLK